MDETAEPRSAASWPGPRPRRWAAGRSCAELEPPERAGAPGSASGREGGGRGRVGGDEQAPLAVLPRPGLRSAVLGAWRRGVRGALAGRARNASGEGARQPPGRAPGAEKRSPGSPAAGARSPGTSQRWNPRNARLRELLRLVGQKSCTFNGLALERVFLPRWGGGGTVD